MSKNQRSSLAIMIFGCTILVIKVLSHTHSIWSILFTIGWTALATIAFCLPTAEEKNMD